MTVQVNVQAPVYYAAAGRIEPLTATDALLLPGGWLGIGALAAIPAVGDMRVVHTFDVQGLDLAGVGTAPVLDWGATTADHVTVGGDDADLDGVDLVVRAGGVAEVRVAAAVMSSIGAVAGDYYAVGVAPAASGLFRSINAPANGGVTGRNGAGGADLSGLHFSAADRLCLGIAAGTSGVPASAQLNATTNIYIGCGGSGTIAVSASSVQVALIIEPGGDIRWQAAAPNPTLYQGNEIAVGGVADPLADHAQDATGGGASVGGDRTTRAGSGVTPGTLRLKNAAATDRLTVHASYAQITAGERLAGVTTVTNAMSPYTILATDRVLNCDVSGGSIVLLAPAVASSAGMLITPVDNGALGAATTITFEPSGAETVCGALNDVMGGGAGTAYASRTYYCTGSDWRKLASYL